MSAITQAASLAASIEETPENFRTVRELRKALGGLAVDEVIRERAATMLETMLGDGVLNIPAVIRELRSKP